MNTTTEWQPTPCPVCLGFCGDHGPTCAEQATPPPRLVPDAIREVSSLIQSEVFKWPAANSVTPRVMELCQRLDLIAREIDAAAPPAEASAHPSRAEPAAEVVMWSDGRGHAITPQEKTRSCAGDVAGYTIPLFAHPSRGVVDEGMVARAMDADAEEYGASIPASRVRRILEAAALPADTITVQEAWEWAGGNLGIKATRADLEAALRDLDAVCDEADAALPAVPEGMVLVPREVPRSAKDYVVGFDFDSVGYNHYDGFDEMWHELLTMLAAAPAQDDRCDPRDAYGYESGGHTAAAPAQEESA